jgi:hypothetical protein
MPSKRRPTKRSKGWEASLAHVVTIMRGPTLKTLAEARAYVLKLPKAKQSSHWDMAIRCLLQAAETGSADGIRAATRAIELAFLYQGQLAIPPKRQSRSVRR